MDVKHAELVEAELDRLIEKHSSNEQDPQSEGGRVRPEGCPTRGRGEGVR